MKEPIGILVGAKGRGSNMAALAQACERPDFPARVQIVVSPRAEAPAVGTAHSMGLNVAVVAPGEDYTYRLLNALEGCSWICLAGYTRLLPQEVLALFPNRVLNIHPALLPKFGGKGMYGHYVHEAVLASGEAESGCSVHLVTEVYDEGQVLLQKRVPLQAGDTAQSLAARILIAEHEAYPEALAEAILASRS